MFYVFRESLKFLTEKFKISSICSYRTYVGTEFPVEILQYRADFHSDLADVFVKLMFFLILRRGALCALKFPGQADFRTREDIPI